MACEGTIEDRCKQACLKIIPELNPEQINSASNFRVDLSAESLEQVEIVMAVEDEFGIQVPDDVALGLETFGDLVNHVVKVCGQA